MKLLNNVAIFVLLILSVSVISDAVKKDVLVGGYTPIKDIKDPHVAEIAQFAVTEYGKQSGTKLILVKVIKGETQVVSGTNYRLVLAAKDKSVTKNYEAIVWEKPWLHFRNLTSFKPL
ncbi:cysteine proteinase inhibitor 1-like protein [Trifolium pratense]|uniref:Cysteine proteinase inhibitor 1-like protein n=1 Tax=Trifolium pratense TaxID=57577 RepID=A0A2K3LR23_TRIPR|nr:cysteine proteinase inhibitor 1-like [Trifolium pratense]PNX81005.1 cysteine proteinase inhibitor 1-like protein [Trifolium pratense]